jgi:hypothetical protein
MLEVPFPAGASTRLHRRNPRKEAPYPRRIKKSARDRGEPSKKEAALHPSSRAGLFYPPYESSGSYSVGRLVISP